MLLVASRTTSPKYEVARAYSERVHGRALSSIRPALDNDFPISSFCFPPSKLFLSHIFIFQNGSQQAAIFLTAPSAASVVGNTLAVLRGRIPGSVRPAGPNEFPIPSFFSRTDS